MHLVLIHNVSNMKKALRDCDLCSYVCFAHSVQLVVSDMKYFCKEWLLIYSVTQDF